MGFPLREIFFSERDRERLKSEELKKESSKKYELTQETFTAVGVLRPGLDISRLERPLSGESPHRYFYRIAGIFAHGYRGEKRSLHEERNRERACSSGLRDRHQRASFRRSRLRRMHRSGHIWRDQGTADQMDYDDAG